MWRRPGPAVLWLVVGLTIAGEAGGAVPSPLLRLAADAGARAEAHLARASRLVAELGRQRERMDELRRERAWLLGREAGLRERLDAARKAARAARADLGKAAAERDRAAEGYAQALRGVTVARHRRTLTARASARLAALAAAASAALLRRQSDLANRQELWRHQIRRTAWLQQALHAIPRQTAELERRLERQRTAIAALVRARTEHLRRAGHARLLALGRERLARLASVAAARSWSLAASADARDLPATVAVGELAPPRRVALSAPPRIGASRAPVVTAPMLLGGPGSATDPPRFVGTPVGGLLTSTYGDRRAGPLRRGITLAVYAPRSVRAPRAGRVVFAAPFRDFGPVLILDHGDGYHTLIAGMARIDVTVGTQVEAGDPVGRMVANPGRPRRLYVELRRHGEPVDPLPWLVAGNSGEAGSG